LRLLALFLASALVATPVATSAFPTELSSELQGVLERYQSASKTQHDAMLGAHLDLDIDGRFTKLREHGQMTVVGSVSRDGELTFSDVKFTGDNRVKTQLISRYLEQEQKAKYGVMNITPQDYEFKVAAILKQGTRTTYVFEVDPRKKTADKFHGELWVDGATGMPLREAGEFSKKPDILLTKPHFARDYELHDGVSVITRFQTSTDVYIPGVGTAVLDVIYRNFSRTAAD
jgi:outer membrane lipoprotein-sorting protein